MTRNKAQAGTTGSGATTNRFTASARSAASKALASGVAKVASHTGISQASPAQVAQNLAATVAPKLSRKRMATRAKLMEAATELFAEKGVSATSLEEICEKAGFTRGALYSNFSDKNDLLVAVVTAQYQHLFEDLDKGWEAATANSDLTLEGVVSELISTLPIDRTYILLTQQMLMSSLRSPELAAITIPLSDHYARNVGAFVTEKLAAIDRCPIVDQEELGEFVIALAERTLRSNLIRTGQAGLDYESLEKSLKTWLPLLLEAVSKPIEAVENNAGEDEVEVSARISDDLDAAFTELIIE
ncbi:hypothetical protein BK816_08575 [Boudabousia tangfeifanii]|uniref:HTH tetR-type domain-containing protein n=1 Tax=Boudabousia tangfeifanii TaxID=1912795 RepID=A0A1D9MM15_9ACTO|nr:TetR/AcrR family transcriptional regulator [Boudabousia tangfeifanii]AOZ73325.1 hypothetical protein BK816_08575 [Boudabousia tangfeifanii]